MKTISILGSTGSIGQSTLDVIRLHRENFQIFALSCNSNIHLLAKQAKEFNPRYIVCNSKDSAKDLKSILPSNLETKILFGPESYNFIASDNNVTHVVASISGSSGLDSTYSAAKTNKVILLANKESLVMAGPLIMGLTGIKKSTIIPLDSEHNAIFQVLQGEPNKKDFLKKIILTASGGPFLNHHIDDLKNVSVDDALKHPNWSMGRKVTIDSSTMMNKALEVIEASYLFGLSDKEIDVLIHPQSIIHSFVEFIDGSYLTQLGNPDMKIPISFALGYPDRIESGASFVNFYDKDLTFIKPDFNKFPCLSLSFDALSQGHNYCVALNAVNEISVQAFMDNKIKFIDIFKLNSKIYESISSIKLCSIEEIINYDYEIKVKSLEFLNKIS
jgi:1-deoxy-D-xylulose-5-phosphate reductoisomerase